MQKYLLLPFSVGRGQVVKWSERPRLMRTLWAHQHQL